MAKPPASGPHSDISSVNRDARVNAPTTDGGAGTAEDLQKADEASVGQPDEDKAAS